MRLATIIILSFICSLTTMVSCSKSGTDGGNGGGGGGGGLNCSTVPNKAFAADVNPIIQSRCNIIACHEPGSVNGPGPLTNFTQVSNARTAIRIVINAGTMPQGSVLTTDQKNSIICWIDSGAPNN